MIPNKVVLEFLVEYNKWLEGEEIAYEGQFIKSEGLCENLFRYLIDLGRDNNGETYESAYNILKEMFVRDGLPNSCPFNDGDLDDYVDESNSSTCHLNERRIGWVKVKIADQGWLRSAG
jgi:hypothetical protein